MGPMIFSRSSSASQDFERTRSMCDELDDELNDFRRHLDVGTIDPDYRQCLLLILRGGKNYKPRKKGRVNAEHICGENDDSNEVCDPQYGLFFESLKKYEKSYVLECKTNDVSVCVKYEGESKFGRKREPKCRRMRKGFVQVDGAADENTRFPNEPALLNQHASDNVYDKKNEISSKKPDLRNKGIIKESEVGYSVALRNRMDNFKSCKRSKNMTIIQVDNMVTDNQTETHSQAKLTKADEAEDVAKAYYVADSESVIRISSVGDRNQRPGSRNNSERENQSGSIGQAPPLDRKKEVSKGKNVVQGDHNPDRKKQLYLKTDPKHNSATKYQVDNPNQVISSEEEMEVQSKTNLPKVKKEKNVVKEDCVAKRKVVNYRDDEPLSSSENNLEEHQHEDADRNQPDKKYRVQSPRKLRKVVHGSYENIIDAASRNGMTQIENKSLFHKPCPRNNQVTKNHIDWARPKQSHRMFKRVIVKERDITDDSDSDVEILDSAVFYGAGNPGPFVTSKKFHESMKEDDDIEFLGRTSSRFDFRRRVMNVLQKPFDRTECKKLREAFMDKSYMKFHPELARKLAIHRHKKGKCLAILRGFFFWLENLTQEGSFKPWKDGECLQVDPTLL